MKNKILSPKNYRYFLGIMLLLFSALTIGAQDQYHLRLLEFLRSNHGIDTVDFVLNRTEQEIVARMNLYGDAEKTMSQVDHQDFKIQLNYQVKSAGNNVWDAGINLRNRTKVSKGEVVLVVFWGRKISATSEMNLFSENSETFSKEIYFPLNLTSEWKQYFAPYLSTADYEPERLTLGFHIADQIQEFQIGGFTALNLGRIAIDRVPSSTSTALYEGAEPDAPWRAQATSRIEELRKHDLVISVVDADGKPLEGARVKVEMQKHAFGFGSAIVACRFPGNRCYDPTYLEKFFDLDGKGHGFNVAVVENALKWDGWEEEWIGTPEETVAALQWLDDRGIKTRGHTLIWPGWNHMPDDMQANQNNPGYLRQRIYARLEEMLTHPVISKLINEWDVLNEITQVRDLEKAFLNDPNYTTGREIYQEILNRVELLNPDLLSYINDYVVFSGGGAGNAAINRYKSYLDEFVTSGAKFDGIGFQCHIGSLPTSILKIDQMLNEFFQRYGKRMKITEYDINATVDDSTQAKYLADFLTIIFSNPGVDAFIMWGFWDGNHWMKNAPIFREDWTLRPSGQVFVDKVFNEWWTHEEGITNEDGYYIIRPFKGEHKITVTLNDETQEIDFVSGERDTVTFNFSATSVRNTRTPSYFNVFPNPTNGEIFITRKDQQSSLIRLTLFSTEGKLMKRFHPLSSTDPLHLDLAPGLYYLKMEDQDHRQISRIVISP